MGEVIWFYKAMIVFGTCSLLVSIFLPKKRFLFLFPDRLILGVAVLVLLTYKWQLEPEPEKLIFGGQLIVLWFLLRFMLIQFPRISIYLVLIIMSTGLIEAIWGLMQLYGYQASQHSLFRLTGSFINPGPYSGYLAVILPVCLGAILGTDYANYTIEKKGIHFNRLNGKNIFSLLISYLWNPRNPCLKYFSWICLIAILLVLPAGMSRSAWIAAIISCGWVYWWYRIGWKKTKGIWRLHRKKVSLVMVIICIITIAGIMGIYQMKKDSANGRLLMWKVTAMAIAKQPIKGVGLGGFPAAFAETQSEYFASRKATETEKIVAGCPEYAFNEYLQIGLEQGVIGLITFLLWLGSILYYGVKNKRYGVTGGILSLMIFAFSSYPLQLPSFWILLIFLSVITINPQRTNIKQINSDKKGLKIINIAFIFALCIISILLYSSQTGTGEAYQKWNKTKFLYNANAYEAAYEGYEELYPKLNHKPEFLFEAGQCLSKMERYEESNRLLERATLLSADPMIHYIWAKNVQALGQYEEAEKRFLHAIDILPERIYPYYLLTKLYAETSFYQPDKMKAAADSVLHKEPKVMTTAIREMREEVKKVVSGER